MAKQKNAAAQALGALGGIARAKILPKERQRAIALRASKAAAAKRQQQAQERQKEKE